jgi:hypothetical protein
MVSVGRPSRDTIPLTLLPRREEWLGLRNIATWTERTVRPPQHCYLDGKNSSASVSLLPGQKEQLGLQVNETKAPLHPYPGYPELLCSKKKYDKTEYCGLNTTGTGTFFVLLRFALSCGYNTHE